MTKLTAREQRTEQLEQERRALAAQKQREQEAQADADGRLPGVSAAKRADVQAEASAWLAWVRGCAGWMQ